VGQTELARLAGISARELARIENGEVAPSKETSELLDDALDKIILERATKDATP
jgi:transcriptional regulator with XRE-family HTH domain